MEREVKLVCEQCGEEYSRTKDEISGGPWWWPIYCSFECRDASSEEIDEARVSKWKMELTKDDLGLFAEATSRLCEDRRLCAFQINGDGAVYFVAPNRENQFLSRCPTAIRIDPWDGKVMDGRPDPQCRDMMERLLQVSQHGPIIFGQMPEQLN